MSKTTTKPAAVAVALAGGILLAGSTFAMEPLAQGYLLAAPEAAKAGEGKCGEGKCGEGKCGMAKADTDKDGKVSQAEFDAMHPGQAAMFAGMDTNKDGKVSAEEQAAFDKMDSNKDGKIDASDDAFSKLQVWVDADNDGISDDGELSSLSDNGVASIALTTDQTGGEEDGQTIFAEGEFTFADGSTGNFVEVGFETIFGSDDGLTVIGTDGDDILHGGMGTAELMRAGTGFDTLARAEGFIAVYPEGTEFSQGKHAWNLRQATQPEGAFVDDGGSIDGVTRTTDDYDIPAPAISQVLADAEGVDKVTGMNGDRKLSFPDSGSMNWTCPA